MARAHPRRFIAGLGLTVIVTGLAAAAAQGPQVPPYKPGRPIAIVGGQLVDATGAPPRTGHTVLIQGDRIVQVGPSASVQIPTGADVIDAEGMTVMPGLINSNQHINMSGLYPGPTANMPLANLTERWGRLWAGADRRAFVFLMQGHTSMRNTSGPAKEILKTKRRVDAGEIPGPRIFLGGGLFRSEAEWPNYVRNTPPDAAAWLRTDLAFIVIKDIDKDTKAYEGADYPYWKLRIGDVRFDGKNDFTDEEIRAFIAKAHRLGKKVDCHCGPTVEHLRRMMQFDIDTLEHPFLNRQMVEQDVIDGYVKKGVIMAPLISSVAAQVELSNDPHRFDETRYVMSFDPRDYRALMDYRDKMAANVRKPSEPMIAPYDATRPPDFPGLELPAPGGGEGGGRGGRPSLDMMRKAFELSKENMRRFLKAGAKIAMGTDTGAFFSLQQEDPTVREMELMVEVGMTPLQVLESSTRVGAEALGMLKDLGTIEKGKLADVIVVAGDPIKDMAAMKRVAIVVKGGVRYK